MKQQFLLFANKARHRWPSPLPIGRAEFASFADSILETYNIPNLPSYHHAIASMIMHLGPTVTKVPKKFFADSIYKAMANEVAFQKIQELKEKEKKALDALETPAV